MLQDLRKMTRGWVAGVFIALLLAAFAMWGINDVFQGVGKDVVAEGRGFEITPIEYEAEFDRALERARSQGETVTREQAVEAGLHLTLLDRMIGERALASLAQRAGVAVSNAQVGEEIRGIEAFRNDITGAFDKATYQRLLGQNRLSIPEFEDSVRRDLTNRQLIFGLLAGLKPPESYARLLVEYMGERRTLDVAQVPASRVPPPPTPTEAQLRQYYQENRARFSTPEYRSLTVVVGDPAAFRSKVVVPEEDLRRAYELQRASLTTPERRSFVQVTAPDAERAREAARRLAAGEDPETIAGSIGGQAIPFEDATRESVPDNAVAAAVFALTPNGTSGAIRGQLAWSAAKVTAITPGAAPTFEEARPQLTERLAADEAEALLSEAEQTFTDLVDEGETMEAAAQRAGLATVKIDGVDRQGRLADGRPAPAVAGAEEFLSAIFELGEGDSTDFLPLGAQGYGVARVDAVRPPGVRPFEDLRQRLEAEWRSARFGEALRAIAGEIKASVAKGETFAAAAAAARAPIAERGVVVDRSITESGPQAQLGQAIFNAAENEVIYAPAPPGGDAALIVVHVAAITRQDAASAPPELLAQAQQAIARDLGNDFGAATQTGAVSAADVRRNEQRAAAVFGLGAASESEAE